MTLGLFFPFAVYVCVYVCADSTGRYRWWDVAVCLTAVKNVRFSCRPLTTPPALTLCGSDHRLAPSHYDKLHTVSLSQQPQHLPKKKEKSQILLIKADIPLRMFGSRSLPLIKLLLSLFT